jgi:hypothetical protein
MTPCSLVGGYHYFGGTYCLHVHCRRWRQYVPLKYHNLEDHNHSHCCEKLKSHSFSLICNIFESEVLFYKFGTKVVQKAFSLVPGIWTNNLHSSDDFFVAVRSRMLLWI